MSDLAPVDELRSLPYPLILAALRRLEKEAGPEAVAALRYDALFWARPAQLINDLDNLATVEVFVGERRTGKTWAARHLFVELVRTGRARLPRIVSSTDAAIVEVVLDGESGIKTWLPPPREGKYAWFKSDGFAGTLHLYGTKIVCCSAAAPGQAIGMSRDVTWADDPAGWVESCGVDTATEAWTQILKSNSQGQSTVIVATTAAGAAFLSDLLSPEQLNDPSFIRIHDLGAVESNRGNLAPNYIKHIVADLRRKLQWNDVPHVSPWAPVAFERMRLARCPALVEIAVAIDPSKSSGPNACEVGIAGGGRDARDVVHVRYDASAILGGGADGWQVRAWDLADRLMAEHPGAEFHFVVEVNTGTSAATDLLRAEERARTKERTGVASNTVRIVVVRSSKDKCERARLPALRAEQGMVKFAENMRTDGEPGRIAEGQLKNLTPEGKNSDRADAIVHLVNDLAHLSNEKEITKEAEKIGAKEAAAAQVRALAGMSDLLGGRTRPPREGDLVKVPGAPPGDARYAGPPLRAVARPSWTARRVM
jgi:phage terminase large subunit-like protein